MRSYANTLTVQKWGNSLAVRIPAPIARSAHIHLGTLVQLSVLDGNLLVKPVGEREPTLDEMLAAFDIKKHGGEVMAMKPVGREKL